MAPNIDYIGVLEYLENREVSYSNPEDVPISAE